MTTYIQEILLSTEPITAYTVEMRGERYTVETEDGHGTSAFMVGTDIIDTRQLLMVYDGNFFTLTPAQIELERSFAQENNVEDRLNQLLSYFEEE